MKRIELSDQRFDEREHIWVNVDIKNLPSMVLTSLAECTTDAEILDALADCPNLSTRLQVAKNIYTTGKTLKRLARDMELSFVREEVARHQNTFPETLLALVNDEDEKVRSFAASNPNTPVDALILKLFDSSVDVVIAAIRNPMTPKENIKMLVNSEVFLIAYEVKKRLESK